MEEQKNNRTKWLHIRLKPEEYLTLLKKFRSSTSRKISDFARHILFGKSITATYRNTSLDDAIAEMAILNRELNAIGNNFNQAVKKLHILQQFPEFRDWAISYELEKKLLFNKIEEIKNHMQKMSEKWLQS
jgi:hypothetical protein